MASLLDTLPQTRMRSLVTGHQHAEWRALRDAWAAALDADNKYGTERTAEAEVQAFDSWADWVEENNLNYTKYDPRGRTDPAEDDDAKAWIKTLIRDDQILLSLRRGGRRWAVKEITADALVVFRQSGPSRFQRRTITGAQLVVAMKANQH